MNGQTMSFDADACAEKDRLAQDFIRTVNPYRAKSSLGIDLRRLAKYAKEKGSSLSESEIQRFSMR